MWLLANINDICDSHSSVASMFLMGEASLETWSPGRELGREGAK